MTSLRKVRFDVRTRKKKRREHSVLKVHEHLEHFSDAVIMQRLLFSGESISIFHKTGNNFTIPFFDLFSLNLIVKGGNGKEESYITQSARFWPWSAAAKHSRAAALSVTSAACDHHTEATLRPAFGAKAQASLTHSKGPSPQYLRSYPQEFFGHLELHKYCAERVLFCDSAQGWIRYSTMVTSSRKM